MKTDHSRSWIEAANGHPDFPLQNPPLGVFSLGSGPRRGGVAIGDLIFDLGAAIRAQLFDGLAKAAAEAASRSDLNSFFAMGPSGRQALRSALIELLSDGSPRQAELESQRTELFYPMSDCVMHLPARVGDYTDFYVGIHHATNVGKLFRPDNPLLPNYKYVPIAYHGRASTLCVSGTAIKRPSGQRLEAGEEVPVLGPSQRMDYELEVGIWIGTGNSAAEPVAIENARQHVAGFCLLNDWSARDLQAWEYQPLGPFLSKSFATTISPWVVTAEALEPFKCSQPARNSDDPQPLAYLSDAQDQQMGAFDIELEVLLLSEQMREERLPPYRLALSNTLNMYWTVAQMVAHHSVNGCQLNPGDLFGTGTLSGAQVGEHGSLLEMTQGGKHPLQLPTGEVRRFLERGDEVILRARCKRDGAVTIGFGDCRGVLIN